MRTTTRTRRMQRAFTLLEVMLAAVLGALVLMSAVALFTAMDRAKRLQNARLEANMERQLAHKTIMQAMRTLVMDSSGEPKDDEMKTQIEQDISDAQSGSTARREDTAIMRFALQPDMSQRSARGQPMQTLDITISTPPIHAISRSTEEQRLENEELRQLSLSRSRSADLWSSRGGDSAKGSGAKGSDSKSSGSSSSRSADSTAARSDRLLAGAMGLGGTPSADRVDALAGRGVEAPRAPGVRGVFEFRPEDDAKVLARASGTNGGPIFALWWKQIPVEDDGLMDEDSSTGADAPPSDTLKGAAKTDSGDKDKSGKDVGKLKQDTQRQRERARRIQLTELARASRTDAPEVKLLSGITDAQWQVYRRRKMVSKMAASYAKELPAYVNLKFETVDGHHDDWLFEVAWTYGQEPGTVLTVNDPLGAPFDPNADAINSAIQTALDAANGGTAGAGGSKPVTGSSGPVASTGSGSGGTSTHPSTGGGGSVSGGNGQPIVITLPGGGTITIPAGAVPGHR